MKKGSTILVVDDEDIHRLILKRTLENNGYVILAAANGAEGLEVMRTLKVDLAIVDLEMPVMNGMEFTKWVKEINPEFSRDHCNCACIKFFSATIFLVQMSKRLCRSR